MGTIFDNLSHIQQQIAAACARTGRDPSKVRLVAVSKTKPASAVLAAMTGGQFLFGENRVQEARDKIPLVLADCGPQPPQWHLIGPLQRNKVKGAIKLFSMVHSVDSVSLARELSKRADNPRPLPILVQVNVGREPQKSGFMPAKTAAAIAEMAEFTGIQVQGLMTVPPFVADAEAVRPFFQELAQLAANIRKLQIDGVVMHELSMGMSHDYTVAVEEGATLVRVGSALFGSREYH